MNRQQRRAKSPLPPRPQMISEQLRDQINANIGKGRRVMNREQCTQFAAMLASNLDHMLNGDDRLPWLNCSIDKRANGFSLHVNIIEPTGHNDAEVPN